MSRENKIENGFTGFHRRHRLVRRSGRSVPSDVAAAVAAEVTSFPSATKMERIQTIKITQYCYTLLYTLC